MSPLVALITVSLGLGIVFIPFTALLYFLHTPNDPDLPFAVGVLVGMSLGFLVVASIGTTIIWQTP